MDPFDGLPTTIAQCMEKLQTNTSSTSPPREPILRSLYELMSTSEDAITAVSCHPQSISILVSIVRSDSASTKTLAAMVIEILARKEEMRTKILLGGCIPLLLDLLKSGPIESQTAAAQVLYAISKGSNGDKVGPKIFAAEGTVHHLWEQLRLTKKLTKPLDGLLTGTLQNLSIVMEGFWEDTIKAAGIDILARLLVNSGNPEAQCHCCHLLATMILEEHSICTKVIQSGCVSRLLKLMSQDNDFSVRAEAAGALKALSKVDKDSRQLIIKSKGIPLLIAATVSPCNEEIMDGENTVQSLREHAMGALANISGGLDLIIHEMIESLCTRPSEIDATEYTLGSLASAIMIFEEQEQSTVSPLSVSPLRIEEILVGKTTMHESELIQERAIAALASLYRNKHLSICISHLEVKRNLVHLIIMGRYDSQRTEFLNCLIKLCNSNGDLWHAVHQRQGVQMLTSLLGGGSSEEQQECAICLLSILSQEIDESKWAITSAGGIPPIVHILAVGSIKAKEYSAIILGNLCDHSEDIRSCVEKTGAVPGLLWMLRNSDLRGQKIAAKMLKHLVSKSDTSSIILLNVILAEDAPSSKEYITDTLGHFLSLSPLDDILFNGSPENESFQSLVRMLTSFKEETQKQAACVFAKLLKSRKDMCQSPRLVAELIAPLHKILIIRNEQVSMHAAQCLEALFSSIGKNPEVAEAASKTLPLLLKLCTSTKVEVLEQAISALANLLLDEEISKQGPIADVIQPLTRVLQEGTPEGRRQAARALSRILQSNPMDEVMLQKIQELGTVLAILTLLGTMKMEDNVTEEVLESLVILVRSNKTGINSDQPLWSAVKAPQTITPLIDCLAMGLASVQDSAIHILSRICKDQPFVIGDKVIGTSSCISALAERIIAAPSTDVQIGATSLLICAAKEHHQQTINFLLKSNVWIDLIHSLVKMLKADYYNKIDGLDPENLKWATYGVEYPQNDKSQKKKHSENIRKNVALRLLCLIASYDNDMKCVIAEAGAMEAIIKELGCYTYIAGDSTEENGWKWISALLIAVLLQDNDVLHSPAVKHTIPLLANLLKSDNSSERHFASQAIANLVLSDDHSTILAVCNSGALVGLISLLGSVESDNPSFLDLAHEFLLVPNPAQTALEHLFRKSDIKTGSTARKVIPALIELLTPSSDRPDAPLFAEGLLAMLAAENPENKVLMAEAGILEALTRYLSLGPQRNMEECTADLFRILFSSVELRCHKSATGALEQLVALLHLGGKTARYSASRALQELFIADHIKANDIAKQAIPPLLEMLRTGSEKEQRIALRTLSTLSIDNQPKAIIIALDPESKCLEFLSKTLWADCSLDLKEDAAALCFALFSFSRIRASPAAAHCIEPLVVLARDQTARSTWLAVLHALNNSFDTTSLSDIAVTNGIVKILMALMTEDDESIYEVALSSLVKLAKANKHHLVEMQKDGADVKKILHLLPSLSDFACASATELLQILTSNGNLRDEIPVPSTVELLLSVLLRPGLGNDGQYSTMQLLINIIGNSQDLSNFKLSPDQPINHLISLLDSTSQQVQKLASELFSHLLVERKLEHSMITKKVVISLIQLVATGMQRAVFALEIASDVLPQAVAESGGIDVVSNVIVQLDPLPPHDLWESAASVVYNVLQNNTMYYWKVPIQAFVRMLQSDNEAIIFVALQAMLTLQKENPIYAEAFAESGALDALMELLRCHQCEEASAQVLEALLNDKKVRSTKIAYSVVAPLAKYLLHPKTTNRASQLLSALALGDIFQQSSLTSSSHDVMLACRALIKILEAHPSQDIKTVAVSALQNIVSNDRVNRQALVEAGTVELTCKLLSSNDIETAEQAATLANLLFSTQTLNEHNSTNILNTLTAALGNNLNNGSSITGDIIKSLASIFTTFPKLCATETAAHCVPYLTKVLNEGSVSVQGVTLDILCQMRQDWQESTKDVSKTTQVLAMAGAIPALQDLLKSRSLRLHEKARILLIHLPGNLVVTIKQGKNLKLKVGSTNAFCKISLSNGPAKETKVVSNTICPQWNQGFSWPFDAAPRGQKVQIVCKSRGTLSKGNLGKVTIQTDRVIALGTITGSFTLQPEKNRDGTARVIEIEMSWSP